MVRAYFHGEVNSSFLRALDAEKKNGGEARG